MAEPHALDPMRVYDELNVFDFQAVEVPALREALYHLKDVAQDMAAHGDTPDTRYAFMGALLHLLQVRDECDYAPDDIPLYDAFVDAMMKAAVADVDSDIADKNFRELML